MVLEFFPQSFDRVEFWAVGRNVVDEQAPLGPTFHRRPEGPAGVAGRVVQDYHGSLVDGLAKIVEHFDDGLRVDVALVEVGLGCTVLVLEAQRLHRRAVRAGDWHIGAFTNRKLKRDATLTYFPLAPGVPDWLSPAVSVHSGDWKLIRIFHGGENGRHRYKLFNLKDDIGEEHNLTDQMPERVQQLDPLIEQHLVETQVVRPLPNPNFDPSKYDESAEGKANLKGGSDKQKTQEAKPLGKLIAGRQPGGTCTLSVAGGVLRVESTGGDPLLSYQLPNAVTENSLTLHLKMKSNSSGQGQIFWKQGRQPFAAQRNKFFDVKHDGNEHEYEIEIASQEPVQEVRIDPSRGSGTIEIMDIQLTDNEGEVIHQWKF